MKWVSAISTRPSLELALNEVLERTLEALGTAPDLAILFISSTFASEYPRVMPLLRSPLKGAHILGGSGSGVIGMTAAASPVEIEDAPALSLTLAHLPGVDLRSFHLSTDELPDLDSPPSEWTEIVGVTPQEQPHFILIADPFSSGMNDLLQGLDFAYPDAVKVGGQAGIESISRSSGLFCGKHLYREGVVGVALSGNVEVDAIVAQGCRPIGEAFRVIDGERNVITEIEAQVDGTPQTPLTALQDMFQTLSEEDRELAQQSLFIGIAQSGFKETLERGDFLIRNLVGVDPKLGAVAIADHVRPGQIVQFHLRDADTSAEDLETLLDDYKDDHGQPPAGALLFACTGRGEGLYEQENFDSELFQEYLGPAPLGGFFCNGEIGPVGRTTFLHGFTSVFGLFRPKHP